MDDCELLREYRDHRSEPAFAALVERHVGLVYAVARRVVREPSAAEDVAQAVFIQLARKAGTVRKGQALSGWLYRATQRAAFDALRGDHRRRQRETIAMNLAEKSSRPEIVPEQLAPFLEEAMGQLRRIEQDAVVLRYFEGKSLRETGAILALSEDAARKRVDRALDKMRAYFARSGITASAALLASALTAHAAEAPPVGLAAKVTGISVANATASAGGLAHALLNVLFMNTATKLALVGFAAVVTTFIVGRKTGLIPDEGVPPFILRLGPHRSPAAMARTSQLRTGKLTAAQAFALWQAWIERTGGSMNTPDMNGLDPGEIPSVLKMIADLPVSFNRDVASDDLLRRLSAADPAMALSLAGMISEVGRRTEAIQNIFSSFGRRDPLNAVAELAKLPVGANTQAFYQKAFMSWGMTDAAAATASALALPAGAERTEALSGAASGWSEHDPAAALAWASDLPPADSAVLKAVLVNVGSNMQKAQIAAQYVESLPDAADRDEIIQILSRQWAVGMDNTDPAAALDWLDQVATGDAYDNNVKYIFTELTKHDPVLAASLLDKVTEPGIREATMASFVSTWGKSDPQAALAWVEVLPDPTVVVAAAPALAQSLAAANPQAALDFAASLPEGDIKGQALTSALTGLAKSDFATAWTYAASLPAGDNPATIMSSLVGALAKQNPAQAAGLLDKFPAGTDQLNATGAVAAIWALDNPQAFSDWVGNLPTGDQRTAAVSAAIKAAQAVDLPAVERATFVRKFTQLQPP